MEPTSPPSPEGDAVPDPLGIEGRIKARRRRRGSLGGPTTPRGESHQDTTAIDTTVLDEVYQEIPPLPSQLNGASPILSLSPLTSDTPPTASPGPLSASSVAASTATPTAIPASSSGPALTTNARLGASPTPTGQPAMPQAQSQPLVAVVPRDRDLFVRDLLLVLRMSVLESLRSDAISMRDYMLPDALPPLTAVDFSAEITLKALLTDANTDWQLRDIAPRCFGRLRLTWGLSADDFLHSWPWRDEHQINQKRDSGNFVLFSRDRRYMMRSLSEREFQTLRSMLPSYFSHMSSNPNSLLPRYFGLHQLQAGGKKSYLVVQDSPVPVPLQAPNVTVFSLLAFDERSLSVMSPTSPPDSPAINRNNKDAKDKKKDDKKVDKKEKRDDSEAQDRDRERLLRDMDIVPKFAKVFTRAGTTLKELRTTRIIVSSDVRTLLFEQLQRDSNFLITQEITDHQLLVSCVRSASLEQHKATINRPTPIWASPQKKSEGIVCFLKQRQQAGVKGSVSGAVVVHVDTLAPPSQANNGGDENTTASVSVSRNGQPPRSLLKLRKNSGYRHRKNLVVNSNPLPPQLPEQTLRSFHGGFRGVNILDSASFYGDHHHQTPQGTEESEYVYFISFYDILQRVDRKKKPPTIQRLGKSQQLEPVVLDLQGYARRLCEIVESATPMMIEGGAGAYIEVNYG